MEYATAMHDLRAYKERHQPMMPADKKGPRAVEIYWTCSNCGTKLRGGYLDSPVNWNFCPNCGARFRKESDTYG